MVSSSNDIHPTPEGTKLRDHVISSGAHGCKDGGAKVQVTGHRTGHRSQVTGHRSQ